MAIRYLGFSFVLSVPGSSSSSGSSGSDHSGFMMPDGEGVGVGGSSSLAGSTPRRVWSGRVAKLWSSCSGNQGSAGKLPFWVTQTKQQGCFGQPLEQLGYQSGGELV